MKSNRMNANHVVTTLLLTLLPAILCMPGRCQEARGIVEGRVTDSTGAVVPGAVIRLTHLGTNTTRTTVTNGSGSYSAPLLSEGVYRIVAEKEGFKQLVREGVEVRINDTIEVDLALEVGQANQSVTVTAEAPLLQSENASVGQVISAKEVSELPVAFGAPFLLMKTGGLVAFTGSGQSQDQPWEPGASVNYNMAGSGTQSASITMDGADNTVRDQGRSLIPNYVPPSDAVEEFKLQTVSFDATTGGGSQGGVMNVSLKSGTNTLHGTGYYSFQPQDWTANQFFSNLNGIPRAAANVKRWGGSANGPVWIPKTYNGKNKTFFMYAYEGIHYASPRGTNFTVPTAAERAGDFSTLLAIGSQYQIYDPLSRVAVGNGRYQETPFTGNILPASRISPIATALLNPVNLPLPLVPGSTVDGSNNYPVPGAAQHVNFYTHTIRVDHNFSQKSRMFARYDRYKAQFADPLYFGEQSLYNGTRFWYHMDGAAFDEVYSFTPTLLMDVRVSDSRYVRAQDSNPNGVLDLTKAYGFPAYYNNFFDPSIRRTPAINLSTFSSFSGAGNPLNWQPQENRALGVTFNKSAGKHLIKFGFEHRRFYLNQYNPNNQSGQGGTFSFGSTYTNGPLDNAPASPRGQDLAAFLLGIPSSGSISNTLAMSEASTLYGLFIQDDWKVTPRLTLNLGLRWELEGPLTERYNRSVDTFDPNAAHTGGDPLVAGGGNFDALAAAAYAANPIAERPTSQWSTLGGLTFAGVNGNPRDLYNRYWKEFMPRLGFAYSLGSKTVLRGGWGIYYGTLGVQRGDVIPANFVKTTNLVPTLDNGLTFQATLGNPYPSGMLAPTGSSEGPNALLGQSLTSGGTPSGSTTLFNRDLPAQRIHHWQLDLQRRLPGNFVLEIGYVGTHGTNLQTTRSLTYFPSQYLSRLGTRDQTLINYWTGNVPNPFAGLLPGTNYNSTVIARSALIVPIPQFPSINMQTAEGYNWYHGGNLQLERRFAKGFTASFSYTRSKLMEATSFLHPDDAHPEYLIGATDFPNHIGLTSIYELPFGRGKALLTRGPAAYILGGWQMAGIWTLQSGRALGFGDAIFYGGDLRSILLPDSQKTIKRWFDTSQFNTNSAQQLSMHYQVLAPRFSWFRAPRQDYLDMSVQKNFRIKEGMRGVFRADALNFLNHPWLGSPNTTPSSTSFGQITSENSRPRFIQGQLKFIF